MTFCAIAMWLGMKLGWVHMHADPSAQLDTSTITDQRQWYVTRSAVEGMVIACRELDNL